MTYKKPEIIALASAVRAIKTSEMKDPIDPVVDNAPNPNPTYATFAAYEADE
jgi:hypothetical protein